jgi:uncharacterized protein YndB with AHSA1/START domain
MAVDATSWKRTSEPDSGKDGATSVTGAKRIEKEVVVAAPLQQVWEAWTTSAGAETFFAPKTQIELRLGGPYQVLFQPDAAEGSRGAEDCMVLTYRPQEMVAFTWSAPPQWPEIRKQRTVVVVQLVELDKGSVKVILQHLGFGEGKDWGEVQQYFDRAWPVVLGRLQERFAKGPLDWEQVRRAREARADR